MANALNDENVLGVSDTEKQALLELLDAQENLDPRLVDLNNVLASL